MANSAATAGSVSVHFLTILFNTPSLASDSGSFHRPIRCRIGASSAIFPAVWQMCHDQIQDLSLAFSSSIWKFLSAVVVRSFDWGRFDGYRLLSLLFRRWLRGQSLWLFWHRQDCVRFLPKSVWPEPPVKSQGQMRPGILISYQMPSIALASQLYILKKLSIFIISKPAFIAGETWQKPFLPCSVQLFSLRWWTSEEKTWHPWHHSHVYDDLLRAGLEEVREFFCHHVRRARLEQDRAHYTQYVNSVPVFLDDSNWLRHFVLRSFLLK